MKVDNLDDGLIIDERTEKDSDHLLIVFGGIMSGLPFPVFEFFNSLKDFPVDKIFIRDHHQAWYNKGVRGVSNDIYGTADWLRSYISNRQYKKVYVLGNSAGGFMSIAIGALIGADKVLAFSPQTFIDRWRRLWYRDNRWKKQLNQLYSEKSPQLVSDVVSFVKNGLQTEFCIYYSSFDRLDATHAGRLKGDNVKLFPYDHEDHNLIKTLRDSGELNRIIKDLF